MDYSGSLGMIFMIFIQRDNKLDVIVFTTVVVMNVIKISSLISAASLASFTFTRKKRSKMSAKTNHLQKKFLIALCALHDFFTR